nr:uracil-DNA glycosylase [Ottowia testudinis]
MQLDERQRAMLAEMGIKVWAPSAPSPVEDAIEKAAARADQTGGSARLDLQQLPGSGAAPAGAVHAARATSARVDAPARGAAPPSSGMPVPPAAQAVALGPRPGGVAEMDWPQLEATVAACRACGLCAGRTQTVFGTGSRTADWMVVGEAPGENEDRQGQPFVGQAGKLLDNMLAALGLSRQLEEAINSIAVRADSESASGQIDSKGGVYIANVLKCRPPGNRNPQPDEIAECEPYLRRQVALVQPKIILAMGRFAVQSLLQTTEPIGRLRGRVHQYEGVPVIVTYHPAYLLRALPEKAKAWADLCLALEVLRGQPPATG